MRPHLWIATLGLLAACAGPDPVVSPVPGPENRADGIVTMSSNGSLFQPTPPDWRRAEAGPVAKRCRAWGFRGGHTFTGDTRRCLAWDRNGRCVRDEVRRYYQCET